MVEPSPTPTPTAARAPEGTGPRTADPSVAPAATTNTPNPGLLLIPLCIGATLSGVITWLNIGFVDGFLWRWSTSFASALPVMALGFALMSRYEKLLQRVMPRAAVLRKLALAVLMALTIELLMSSVITLRNVGWAEGFAAAWASAFVRSLPVGLAIGLFMGFVVRPRLQRLSARPVGA